MFTRTKQRLSLLAYFFLGSAVGGYLIYLLVQGFGSDQSLRTITHILPVALVAVVYFLIPLFTATQSWRLLFPPGEEPAARMSTVLTWIGLSVNWLLPVAMVGGEVVKFRLAFRRVPPTGALVASLIGDKMIQVVTQLLYTLLGLSVLSWSSAQVSGGVREAAGFVSFCLAVYLFYRLQRAGMFAGAARRLKTFVRDRERVELGAERIDAAIEDMYGRRGRWWCAVGWRILFRVLFAAEVALVMWWLGQPVMLGAVLALESLTQASRVAALLIPAALGAQETVIMAAGLFLGYPAEALIVVALVKRIRELLVGGAGLIAWHHLEARELLKTKT